MAAKAKKQRCKGKSKATGKRCKAWALKGTDRCGAHPLSPDSTRFGSPEQAGAAGKLGGRPRLPRPHEVLREMIEADIEEWLAPLVEARGKGKPIKTWDGKQHKIIYVGDPELGMKATKLAFSLVYGKPRQPLEITGEDGGAIELESDLSDPQVKEALFDVARAIDARRRDA